MISFWLGLHRKAVFLRRRDMSLGFELGLEWVHLFFDKEYRI